MLRLILKYIWSLWFWLPRYYGTALREDRAGRGTKPEVQPPLVTQPMPRIDFDAVNWILAKHRPNPKAPEVIATIVVTNVTKVGIVLRCRYKKQWHLLVSPEDWRRVIESSGPQPVTEDGRTPFIWLAAPQFTDVPVVESDELGRQILSAAMTAQNLNQNKARLN